MKACSVVTAYAHTQVLVFYGLDNNINNYVAEVNVVNVFE